jgi:hypothetical protein
MGNLFGLIETHTLSFGILNGTKQELAVCLEFKTVPCSFLTLCSQVVNLINYPLMPEQFKFFEFSTPKCTVTYILTL